MVVEQTGRGERGYDIYSRLLVDRIVFPGHARGRHGGQRHHRAVAVPPDDRSEEGHPSLHQLPGGSVTAGLAIYDTMQFLTCDVNTYCIGQAASMGAVLLAAAPRANASPCPMPAS
jgi:ATP-dependent Clp protease, protease subunit